MPNFLIEKWSIQSFWTVNDHYQSINYSNIFMNLSLFPRIYKRNTIKLALMILLQFKDMLTNNYA